MKQNNSKQNSASKFEEAKEIVKPVDNQAIGGFSLESKEKEPSSNYSNEDFELLESVAKLGASHGKKDPIKKNEEAAIDDMFKQ